MYGRCVGCSWQHVPSGRVQFLCGPVGTALSLTCCSLTAPWSSFAACEVLQAATASIVSFVLVPLDVTSRYAVPFSRLIHTVEAGASPTLHAFLSTILTRPRAVLQALGYLADCFEMHDPFAAWYAVCHAINADSNVEDKGWTLVHREFSLERRGEWTKGMCVVDKR